MVARGPTTYNAEVAHVTAEIADAAAAHLTAFYPHIKISLDDREACLSSATATAAEMRLVWKTVLLSELEHRNQASHRAAVLATLFT